MDRKILWNSGLLDEIELVYEKAKKDDNLKMLMMQLEENAFVEAEDACLPGGLLAVETGATLTPEQFADMPPIDKETAIVMLSRKGLGKISMDYHAAFITVKLSCLIQKTLACTIFDLLNRLEKLDGSVNIKNPKWTLNLVVPLGGKKGLLRWEMFIMQLYPWISVHEESSDEIVL